MSEHLPSTPEQDSQPELTNEVRLASILDEIKLGAQYLLETTFDTEEAAEKAQQEYVDTYADKLHSVGTLRRIEVIATGGGVKVPKVAVKRLNLEEHGEGVFFSVGDRALRALDPGEETSGYIAGVYGLSVPNESADGYHAKIVITMNLSKRYQESIQELHSGMNSFEITGTPRARIEVDMSAFEIASIRKEQRLEQLRIELARLGLDRGDFNALLERLRLELEKEVPHKYIPMDPEIVQSLGKLGSAEAQKGNDYAYIVSQAILEYLEKNRLVEVTYKEKTDEPSDQMITGHVLDIVMIDDKPDEPAPAIAIETADKSRAQQSIHVVKFEQISSLGF